MNYTVYNISTGKIRANYECNPAHIENQYDSAFEIHIEGTFDRNTQKIVNGEAVNFNQTEQDDHDYALVEGTFPRFNGADYPTDAGLNIFLDDYFIGKEDITQWRIDNYNLLRLKQYPPASDFTDGQVKLSSGISEIVQEGQRDLEKYVDEILEIKMRFPKE